MKFQRSLRSPATRRMLARTVAMVALSILNSQLSTLLAQATACTYQGRLDNDRNPANGRCASRFILYDSNVGGSQQGPTLATAATALSLLISRNLGL